MTFSVFIDGTDRSDYILEAGPVPHIKRDRILQPLGGSFNMTVTQNFTPAYGDAVLVKVGGNIRFSGYVTGIVEDYENETYKLEVSSSLLKLKNYKIDYATVHSVISSGGSSNQYRATDNEGYPNVAVLWLLQKMFVIAGLTLDISEIEDRVVESGGVYGTVLEDDLVLDENMLYALNQATACNNLVIDSSPGSGDDTFEDAKITFWEFFQRWCIGRQYYVQPTTTANQFILYLRVAYSAANNYSVADDDKLNYEVTGYNSGAGTDNNYELKSDSEAVGGAVSTIRGLYAGVDFATSDVNTSTNVITSTAHGMKSGSVIRFTTTDTLPDPLLAASTYFIINETANTFQVSATKDGSAISFTDQGVGTHTYYGQYDLITSERQGYGGNNVPLWNNFWIKYHTSGTSTGEVQAGQQLSTTLMMGGYQNYYHIDPQPTQKITTADLDYTKYRILEHWLNIEDRTETIIQPTI